MLFALAFIVGALKGGGAKWPVAKMTELRLLNKIEYVGQKWRRKMDGEGGGRRIIGDW